MHTFTQKQTQAQPATSLALANAAGNREVRRALQAGQTDTAPASVDQALNSPGSPLEPALRQDMEQHFRSDFSRVRVHSGAVAEQSARDVNANAYTVGQDVVFDAGAFQPRTHEGRRLIAHELTHVVQQSKPAQSHSNSTDTAESEANAAANTLGAAGWMPPVTTAVQPGLIQRETKGSDAKQAGRAKVVAAMERLKKKYQLNEVSEDQGATWSEAELAQVDAAFSKMSPEEQGHLKGLYLVRVETLTAVQNGKRISPAGMTTNGVKIELTKRGLQGTRVPLHEAGHVLQSKVVREAEGWLHRSRVGYELEVARLHVEEALKKAPRRVSSEYGAFGAAISQVSAAASDLMQSEEDDLENKRDALTVAQSQADYDRISVEKLQNDPTAKAWLEVHDRQRVWVSAVERWVEEKAKAGSANMMEFVGIVKKNNLARKSFAAFTDYVASNWPHNPKEFLAESYSLWRDNRNYMKLNARPLFEWFEKGGHLPPKRSKPTLRDVSPEAADLVDAVDDTIYTPFKEGMKDILLVP